MTHQKNCCLILFAVVIAVTQVCCDYDDVGVYFPGDIQVPVDHTGNATHPNTVYNPTNQNLTIVFTFDGAGYSAYFGSHTNEQRGWVIGFRCYVTNVGWPFQLSIWRSNYYDYIYIPNGNPEDYLALVTITSVIEQDETGYHTYWLDTPVFCDQYCTLGITFGLANPIPFDIVPYNDCFNYDQNMFYSDTSYAMSDFTSTSDFDDYGGNYMRSEPECHSYALTAFMEPMPDIFDPMYEAYSSCQLIQMIENMNAYEIKSHTDFNNAQYSNNMDVCWRVRAPSANSRLHIRALHFNLEYQQTCGYDALTLTNVPDSASMGAYCGVYDTDLVVLDSYNLLLYFTTDYSVTRTGFHLEIRSIPDNIYQNYLDDSNYVFPWDDGTWTPRPATVGPGTPEVVTVAYNGTQPESEASAASQWFDSLTLIQRIGTGLGIIVFGLFLLGGFIALCYWCCCYKNPNKGKVHDVNTAKTASGLPQNKAKQNVYYQGGRGVNGSVSQSQGVYTVPQQGNRLPPLATNMPSQPKQPYPLQRYLNDMGQQQQPLMQPLQVPSNYPPNMNRPTPGQPSQPPMQQQMPLPPPPPYPQQQSSQLQSARLAPVQPPKYSMGEVALALRQPKPLKPINSAFGGGEQPQKTDEELYALGRARLNWQNVATIPTAAVYEEPNRGASGGKAPPPPPPGYSGARQNKYYDDPDAWMYCEPDE